MSGRTAALRRPIGLSAAAGVVLAVVVLWFVPRGNGPGWFRLADVANARVVSVDGSEHTAMNGELLNAGDRVITDAAGHATLVTGGRRVVLDPVTEVLAPRGDSLEIIRGSVLVDRRSGPALTLRAADVVLDRMENGALRIDRGYAVRIAVYTGTIRARTASGKLLSVPGLFQFDVAGRALPEVPAPLTLTGHPWESDVIPDVVADDTALHRLAAGIDSTPALRTVADAVAVLPAAYRPAAGTIDPKAGGSELLVARAIGEAASTSRSPADRIASAVGLRRAGGSWGVVAALLHAPRTDVFSALSAIVDAARGPGVLPPTENGGGVVARPVTKPVVPVKPATGAQPAPPGPQTSVAGVVPPVDDDPVQSVVGTVENLLPVAKTAEDLLDPLRNLTDPLPVVGGLVKSLLG